MRRLRRGTLAALALALAAAAAAPVFPAGTPLVGAPSVRAAGIDIATDARYVLDPGAGVVRVAVDVVAENVTPNETSGGVVTRYFYESVVVAIHDEARRVRASSGGTTLRVSVRDEGDYRVATVSLGRSLFYRQTASFRLEYELPGGAPRSASDIRVGAAFATFYAWAFGDRGTVRVEIPADFDVSQETSDRPMQRTVANGMMTLTASVTDANAWWAWLTATNRDGLTRVPLALPGGEQIVVRAWPEDAEWRLRVATLLEGGVPRLGELIGLPWPVDGPLVVVEVYAPLLEGYAGFYDLADDEITISEELDDITIIHEAAHAWFNDRLFAERWIYEGLAEEYASIVLERLGGSRDVPGGITPRDPAAFALVTWGPPSPIRDDEAAARERYGYGASWAVIHEIVKQAGEDGMRAVFRAAHEGTIAYVGAVPPEPDRRVPDWRRLLDLLEELAGVDGAEALLRTWVVDDEGAAELDARATARAAYAELVAAGDGWLPPIAVRQPMATWRFDDAAQAIEAARAVLAARDARDVLARGQGLVPPDGLRYAYESAPAAGIAAAQALVDAQRAALDRVVAAGAAIRAERDWITQLGIDGSAPEDALAAARAAWEGGDMTTATGRADEALALMAAAPNAGRTRALAIGGASAAGVLVVIGGAALVVRSRRRPTVVPLAAMGLPVDRPAATAAGVPPEAPDGYATLAGAPREPAPGEAPPYEHGGPPS